MPIDSIVLHVRDLQRMTRFWSDALGYRLREGGTGEGDASPVLVPERGPGVPLTLDTDDTTHLDLRTGSAAEQQAEVERLISLGARRLAWDLEPGATHVVLADPEGNPFCVVVDAGVQNPETDRRAQLEAPAALRGWQAGEGEPLHG
ncbi:VOC family protein [Kineococcus glutinatus]|uniref:VOC domain-containing protein n=1 Tax=Kineococcus glutinatus TaxID=1070872 RepID=A0ABP9H883_9ACTN